MIIAIAIGALSVGSFATSVGVSAVIQSTHSGVLTEVYSEDSGLGTSLTPLVDTVLSMPSGTGSTSITKGSTDYLWSTQFTKATSIPAGQWVLDTWASGASSGTMTVTIVTTNSAGTTQTTVLSATSTSTIGTSKTLVVVRATGTALTIPADGYVCVSFLAPSTGPTKFTLDWGSGQMTNIQVPLAVTST